MTSVHDSDTGVRYSPLTLSWSEKGAIPSRSPSSTGSEDTSAADTLPKHANKHAIYYRAIAFIALEIPFLTFAYYCLLNPIHLQSYPDPELDILPSFHVTRIELKAMITAVSVVWHTMACLLIRDIVARVQSAEFMALYWRLGGLSSGASDRVSTLTSGLVDNIIHFIRGSPTGEFRLAFAAMLILAVIGPLGSGTFTVETITVTSGTHISVTNLTSRVANNTLAKNRIPLMMRLEREQNTTFKYDMTLSSSHDPVLIPWPILHSSLHPQSTLVYQSDVLRFHFQCTWMAPSFVGNISQGTKAMIQIDNRAYFLESELPDPLVQSYKIIALSSADTPQPLNATILFVGVTQHPPNPNAPTHYRKNMTFSGLPHIFTMTWRNTTVDPINTYNLTGAILQCNPGSSIAPATVSLAHSSLKATKLPNRKGNLALIGNIPPPGAEPVVALLNSAITHYAPSADDMFLKVQGTIKVSNHQVMEEKVPLSLDKMAANVDLYMKSAGKAFLSGLIVTDDGVSTTMLTMNRTAHVKSPVAALVSSKPFLVVFTVVIGLIVALLGALLWTIRQTELNLFNLDNLSEILGSKQ